MVQFVDLEDPASLEKLEKALLKNPNFVVSMTKRMMEVPELRDMILNSPEFKEAVENKVKERGMRK